MLVYELCFLKSNVARDSEIHSEFEWEMGWEDGVGMRCYQLLSPWINRGQKLWGKKVLVSCVFRGWKASNIFFFFQISSDFKPWKFRNYFTYGGWGNKEGDIFFSFSENETLLGRKSLEKELTPQLCLWQPYHGAASRVTESLDFLPVKQVEFA